jgi:glycosyltransferase involved in cell wall biosynthesis
MRILIVSNLYPPHDLGGWEQNCQEVARRLVTRGHTCHILTSRYGVQDHTMPEEGIIRTLYLEADIHYYRPFHFFIRRPKRKRANRRALRQTLDAFEPDVVFIWGMWNLSSQVAYWAEQWMPERVAYAVAGYWPMQPNAHEAYWQRPARRWWGRALMAPARWMALRALARQRQTYPLALHHVVCVSEYVREKLLAAGVISHEARVIYNGIDPRPFLSAADGRCVQSNTLRLVYTGGLTTHKGVRTAVEALGLLKERDEVDGLRLTVVGSGHPDYEALLHRMVEDLGLVDAVVFRGRVPRGEIPEILAEHDVFLFTSIYEEPIARSVMEAMAAGLAVIGTPVGGQREILESGVNALVYPPNDEAQLADRILQLRQDPKLLSRLVEAGRKTIIERFRLERMVDEMEAWLQELVA